MNNSEWTPVSEENPDVGVEVLTGVLVYGVMTDIYVDQWYKCPEYGDECWLYNNHGIWPYDDKLPTHWCKIPEFTGDGSVQLTESSKKLLKGVGE